MATKKKTESNYKTTFSQVIVWRKDDENDFEIKISRSIDETWVINQLDTSVYIIDDAGMAAFIDACSNLLTSQK